MIFTGQNGLVEAAVAHAKTPFSRCKHCKPLPFVTVHDNIHYHTCLPHPLFTRDLDSSMCFWPTPDAFFS